MLLEHERSYGLGMDAVVTYVLGTRKLLWFGHGYALVTACSCSIEILEPSKTLNTSALANHDGSPNLSAVLGGSLFP